MKIEKQKVSDMRKPSATNHKAIEIQFSLLLLLLSTAAYTCISKYEILLKLLIFPPAM